MINLNFFKTGYIFLMKALVNALIEMEIRWLMFHMRTITLSDAKIKHFAKFNGTLLHV